MIMVIFPSYLQLPEKCSFYFLNSNYPKFGISWLRLWIIRTRVSCIVQYSWNFLMNMLWRSENIWNYEDKVTFPYVLKLLNGEKVSNYTIAVFRNHHNDIESKLVELENILIKYYPDNGNSWLTEVLFDIFSCEMDSLHIIRWKTFCLFRKWKLLNVKSRWNYEQQSTIIAIVELSVIIRTGISAVVETGSRLQNSARWNHYDWFDEPLSEYA